MFSFNWNADPGAHADGVAGDAHGETSTSIGMQYFAYAVYVVAEALISFPLLYLADAKAPGTIDSAVLVTALGAGGLMFVAHRTRKDFSFLRANPDVGRRAGAGGHSIGGAIFGFQLGLGSRC